MSNDQMTHDIIRKCSEDVSGAIERNMMLVAPDHDAMAQVTMMGAASAVGADAGAYAAILWRNGVPANVSDTADAAWSILRPMVVRGLERGAEHAKAAQDARP